MKAHRVKHLDPRAPLADNLQRIIETRLGELCSFMPRAADPRRVTALHDMRIAAKRLRYVLEVSEGIFGPYAGQAGKRTKDMQDLLGEIHDCDVLAERLAALERKAKEADLVAAVGGGTPAQAPNRAVYQGLASMLTDNGARRALLFERFGAMWLGLEREGFAARLRFAVSERPCSQDVNGGGPGRS